MPKHEHQDDTFLLTLAVLVALFTLFVIGFSIYAYEKCVAKSCTAPQIPMYLGPNKCICVQEAR